ncbi:hypothetical protein HYDPIDRAFT_190913 [Hydnomerulius pinastri MD-312]|uniref:Protein kinase domain-containing protein n=1 Tax=Hydnomerulius pinastri MD-312 TaxID=994086 RepID=A0A0C9W6W5_9AGAM|nr:hypothetical protein HYDPIDRAFT_190913 [Hydnomerulius pinastri MD-312]
MSWKFPCFLNTINIPTFDAWRKFTPKNGFMVTSTSHSIPFLISEVIPNSNEQDRYRMLLQAVATARAGCFLMKHNSMKKFFVVAIHVTNELTAERYIVMARPGNDIVDTYRKEFILSNPDHAAGFFLEMHNLTAEIDGLSRELDTTKARTLTDISKAVSKDTIEGTEEMENEDDYLGVFESDDIQAALRDMNYELSYVPFGHCRTAIVISKIDKSTGWAKYVEEGSKEVEILQYLSAIRSPTNHTIADSRVLSLFEAVAFMHEHGVAHMDTKPSNVVIPPGGGWLSIIDFNASVRVASPTRMFKGVVRTEDYIAPEVCKGRFRPMLADLWSYGKTLQELCLRCQDLTARCTLLEISDELMHEEPAERPTMATVLERMSGFPMVEHATSLV